ncbi:peroxide stress protein YaaA [Ruminococcus gauvreauii]|uniref:peroxide stress protein YaaA n=1 Tax=Ruminococcus gauvreauii TaxID=438033 RepID=UPI003983FDB7
MKIIISPAKKMNIVQDFDGTLTQPALLDKTSQICRVMKEMSLDQLEKLWHCSRKLALTNYERHQTMNLHTGLSPALLTYEGLQYQYMAPHVFSGNQWQYVLHNLRILSGFYGVLRPLDGVAPYRLEMQAPLAVGHRANLYEYWGSLIAENLCADDDLIVNLASHEYSRAVLPHLPGQIVCITCDFKEAANGRLITKGTRAKMARGEMVHFLAGNDISGPDGIKEFHGLNYAFQPSLSSGERYVFVRTSD